MPPDATQPPATESDAVALLLALDAFATCLRGVAETQAVLMLPKILGGVIKMGPRKKKQVVARLEAMMPVAFYEEILRNYPQPCRSGRRCRSGRLVRV